MAHDDVVLIAVNDEQALAVGGDVLGLGNDLDAPEDQSGVIAREFVVIARRVDDLRSLARLAQQLLNDVVVSLRPVPAALQAPAVDDVAHEIDRVRIVMAQKVDQQLCLKPARPQVQIREKQSAIAMARDFFRHPISTCFQRSPEGRLAFPPQEKKNQICVAES